MYKSILLILLSLGTLLFLKDAHAQEPLAQIIYLEGKVEVRFGAGEWQAAEAEMPLHKGDELRTAEAAFVEIAFGPQQDKNVIKVDANTIIKLDGKGERVNIIRLSSGKIFSLISKMERGAAFEIATPTVVAGARGTGWVVQMLENLKVEAAAFINNIYVQSFNEQGELISEVIVGTGFKTLVEQFEAAGELTEVTSEELEQWGKWYEGIRSRLGEFIKAHFSLPDTELSAEAYEEYENLWDDIMQEREYSRDRVDQISQRGEEPVDERDEEEQRDYSQD